MPDKISHYRNMTFFSRKPYCTINSSLQALYAICAKMKWNCNDIDVYYTTCSLKYTVQTSECLNYDLIVFPLKQRVY